MYFQKSQTKNCMKKGNIFMKHQKYWCTHITSFLYLYNIKDIPGSTKGNVSAQIPCEAIVFFLGLHFVFDLRETMILTYILSVDTRIQPVWGGGGRAVRHRSVLSRQRFIWRLETQKQDSLKLSDTQCVSTFSEPTSWQWTCWRKDLCLQDLMFSWYWYPGVCRL